MKHLCFYLSILFLSGCSINENLDFSDLIVGKWVGSNRIVYFTDGTSLDNLSTGICERRTELILSADGNLNFIDFKEKDINDGDIDICVLNTLTSEEGIWELLPSERIKLRLTNTMDGSEILIEPYEINMPDDDSLEIRYREFEDSETFQGKEIAYYVYEYFRVFIN